LLPTLFYRWQKELFENGRVAKAVDHPVCKERLTFA